MIGTERKEDGQDLVEEKKQPLVQLAAAATNNKRRRKRWTRSVLIIVAVLPLMANFLFGVSPSMITPTRQLGKIDKKQNGVSTASTTTKREQGPGAVDEDEDTDHDDSSSWPPLALINNLFASDDDGPKRLVVAASNYGYADFADNFMNSLMRLNVSNFVMIPLDEQVYKLLHTAYPKHTLPLWSEFESGVDGAANYGTAAFKKLTSTRPTFLRPFLEKNISVFYNDIDMVWRRNAFDELDRLDATSEKLKLWKDGNNLCSCAMFLPPTNFSLLFLSAWEDEIRSGNHTNDQPAMNVALRRLNKGRVKYGELRDKLQAFDSSDEFPTGKDYFKKDGDKSKAIIIHNNWIAGKTNKQERFAQNGLWNLSGRLPPDESMEGEPMPVSLSPLRSKSLMNWTANVTVNTVTANKTRTIGKERQSKSAAVEK